MKPLLLNTILFLASLTVGAQNSPATNPYFLNEPDFQNLIPFSKDQLEKIKNLGIVRIEETWAPNADTSTKTSYHFNDLGHLIYQQTTDQLLDSSALIDSTHYVYNNNGHLILKKMNGRFYSSFDSLAYDSKSQVIYYDSFSDLKFEDTVEHEINFKLRPRELRGDTILLVDLFNPEYPAEYHFYENTLVKVKDSHRTDSIVISPEQSGGWKKTYWFKNHLDSGFRVGMTKAYKDSLLTSTSIFEMHNPKDLIKITRYYYNPNKELIRIIEPNKETFLTYTTDGLIESKTVRIGNDLALSCFKYYYRHKEKTSPK